MIYCNYELTEHSVLNNSKEIKYRTLDSKGFKDIIFPEVKIPIVIDKIDNN